VSTWPKSLATIDAELAGIPRDERDLMVWRNAERIWNI
jgi:hypothetical protein